MKRVRSALALPMLALAMLALAMLGAAPALGQQSQPAKSFADQVLAGTAQCPTSATRPILRKSRQHRGARASTEL
jgi:hypothetical protein